MFVFLAATARAWVVTPYFCHIGYWGIGTDPELCNVVPNSAVGLLQSDNFRRGISMYTCCKYWLPA
jgi:hypothetical protein